MASVALITMPFAPYERPSIQLGLLEGILAREGIPAREHYLSIDFFELLHRERLAAHYTSSTAALIAEWYFSERPFSPAPGSSDFHLSVRLREYARERGLAWADMTRIRNDLAPVFLDASAAAVGEDVKVACFTVSFPQVMASVALARRLKARNGDIAVVFGGAYTQLHEESARELMRLFPWIDVAALGDAEPVFAPLVRGLLEGGGPPALPGLVLRTGGGIHATGGVNILERLDEAPVPDYDAFFARMAALERNARACLEGVVPVELSRGCPWSRKKPCSFCAFSPHAAYTVKSAPRIREEMRLLAERTGAKGFYSVDAALPPRLIDEALAGDDPDIHLTFLEVRADLPRRSLELLAARGTGLIQPGIEALDDGLLQKMAKGVTAAQNLLFLKRCRELGLRLSWNLILGLPDATEEEVARQLSLLPALRHLEPPYPMPLAYVRFSSYWLRDCRDGRYDLAPEPFIRCLYPDGADLGAIAFEFSSALRRPELEGLYRRTLDEVALWRRLWTQGEPPFLRCAPCDEGGLIEDGRAPDAPPEVHVLSAREYARYARAMDAPCPAGELEEEDAPGLLKAWVDKGLAVVSGGQYLALATGRPEGSR